MPYLNKSNYQKSFYDNRKNFLINALSVKPTTAYSLRRLNREYAGSAIRVRRASDNDEKNIGFSGVELDTISLIEFVGADNGFVTTWYDQSGNGNDAIQTTASNQPRIVNAGVVDTVNSKPIVRYPDAVNSNCLLTANSFAMKEIWAITRFGNGTETASYNAVQGLFSTLATSGMNLGAGGAPQNLWYSGSVWDSVRINGVNPVVLGNTVALPLSYRIMHFNRVSGVVTDRLYIGIQTGTTSRGWSGVISEFIVFGDTTTDAQRQKLERNQGKYFGITVI
jgi:hypothetical protein